MQHYIGKIVQLIYIDCKREVSIRNVQIFVGGDKQFKAYCFQANAIRTFNLSGVVDIEVLTPHMIEVLKDVNGHSEKNKKNSIQPSYTRKV